MEPYVFVLYNIPCAHWVNIAESLPPVWYPCKVPECSSQHNVGTWELGKFTHRIKVACGSRYWAVTLLLRNIAASAMVTRAASRL
jgi:hypothetical protein